MSVMHDKPVTNALLTIFQVTNKKKGRSIATNVAVMLEGLDSTRQMMSTSSMPRGRYSLEILKETQIQLN